MQQIVKPPHLDPIGANAQGWESESVASACFVSQCGRVWGRCTQGGAASPRSSCPLACRTGHSPQCSVTPKRATAGASAQPASPSRAPRSETPAQAAPEEVSKSAPAPAPAPACCFQASAFLFGWTSRTHLPSDRANPLDTCSLYKKKKNHLHQYRSSGSKTSSAERYYIAEPCFTSLARDDWPIDLLCGIGDSHLDDSPSRHCNNHNIRL
jgi:hypothetical protein